MRARRIVILTGAGISAESGLGTFRDAGGVWSRYDLVDVATPEGFARDPALVHEFYNARRVSARAAQPNAAHHALARLEARGPEVTLVTQNVDDLHERAGSRRVLHMHGRLDGALCGACGHRWDAAETMAPGEACPSCAAGAGRPDVVWFGEMPYHMPEIEALLARCDIFVAIGTSGNVYPASAFVEEAAMAGAHTLELNKEPSEVARAFGETRYGPASQVVPAWVEEFLGGSRHG
ncbi:NAD-dependent deacylase [Roseitranquillus sediminis]|uniref:NAD-dependent deacylase n=1 Tax=Roseitranquillus sediminis TaxID=2809051 RepID=UPI001D0C12E2|nr:NAD-dependent deacylase [Roseitranquillus sediminis]MBM9594349.1 NAD-dependent deacylase [Roseitranquillus sediminis]